MPKFTAISICREGWIFLLILGFLIASALLRNVNLLILMSGMMIGPFLIHWWIVTWALRQIEIERRFPKEVCANDLLVVDLTVHNRRQRFSSWFLTVEDTIYCEHPSRPNTRQKVASIVPHLAANRSFTTSYQGRLEMPGRYRFGPLQISTRFPFGLLQRSVTLNKTETLIVYPQIGTLSRKWTTLLTSTNPSSRRTRHRKDHMEGSFYALRDWRSGDSKRWIHWRTSAKHGELKVREFEQQRSQNIAIILELWAPKQANPHQLSTIRQAVSFTATIAEDLCRHGDSDLLVTASGSEAMLAYGAGSNLLLREIMTQLACITHTSQDNLPVVLKQALEKSSNGTQLVLISSRPVDLNDTQRFADVWKNPQQAFRIESIICINAASNEIDEYFQMAPKYDAEGT